jgi:3-deoxy-D-manno-octulosonate 8-phosphate phosphatase KdsC-like HAD superfamily phosphatase
MDVMEQVGIPICPADANEKIRELSIHVTKAKGGGGVVREVADWLTNLDT